MDKMEMIRLEATKELSRRNLLDFLIFDGNGRYKNSRHIQFLSDKAQQFLEDVKAGKSPRLYICMPPRHSKSETMTKKFPAWIIGNNPDYEIIIASYSMDLARDFGKIARDTYREHSKNGTGIFNNIIDRDKSAGDNWGISEHRGAVVSTGVGGSATGKGAHIAIIDDPFKNREDANSKLQRDKVWAWYQSTIRTRLAPGGGIIIIQTRWHEDDLVGRISKEMESGTGEVFESIVLPAIAEENDILGRNVGEALWEERYGLKELKNIKKAIGSREFAALYQQRPQIEDGGLFKRQYFKYFYIDNDFIKTSDKNVNVEDCFYFQTIDTAMSTRKNSDYTAIATFMCDREWNLYLIDLILERLEVPDQWNVIKEFRNRYKLRFQAIESKSSGIGIIQQANREGMPLKELKADTDKMTRALNISVMFENGKVYFNKNLDKLFELEEELLKFPNALHDDAVDVCSYAGIVINDLIQNSKRYIRKFISV